MNLYIDPGTGSMMFAILLGALSTGYFFLRKAILWLKVALSGGKSTTDKQRLPYVIFSDDKRYWNVFEPICDEFERRGLPLAYWTASPDDPALEATYEHVTCEFIGEGNRAFARLNVMSADICLSTTPGLDVYQWKRSKDVLWYVHTLHSVDSAATYHMFGLDYYNAVLLSGEFQIQEIRELERLRGLPAKELPIVGCTYLDRLALQLDSCPIRPTKDGRTVLLAPSWGSSAILSVFGERIIEALLSTGYSIIVRPHPESCAQEADLLEKLMLAYPNSAQLSWNFDNDNFDSLVQADILITDFSGIIFDFALVFDKPVIYAEGKFDPGPYDAYWLKHPLWKFNVCPLIGTPLNEADFPRMAEVIDRAISDHHFTEGRLQTREQAWSHRGESAVRTVEYLVAKHDQLCGPGESGT